MKFMWLIVALAHLERQDPSVKSKVYAGFWQDARKSYKKLNKFGLFCLQQWSLNVAQLYLQTQIFL